MSPPAASVDFRPPFDFNSAVNFTNPPTQSGNPNPNFDTFSFNTGGSSSPSSTFPAVGRVGQSTSGRPKHKPRLAKQRRSSKTMPSAASVTNDFGINPFKLVNSSNVDSLNCDSSNNGNGNVIGAQINNVSFVFGLSSTSNNVSEADASVETSKLQNGSVNLNSKQEDSSFSEKREFDRNANKQGDCDVGGIANVDDHGSGSSVKCNENRSVSSNSKQEDCRFSVKTGDFVLNAKKRGDCDVGGSANVDDHGNGSSLKCGENGSGFNLEEELRKLNIENKEKGIRFPESSVGVANGGSKFYVFKSGEGVCDVLGGSSVSLQSGAGVANANERNESGDDGKFNGLGSQSVGENVFVFGSGGTSNKVSSSASQSFSFSAESDGAGAKKDMLRGSFSFSSRSAEGGGGTSEACSVTGETRTECSALSVPESCGTPAVELRLPEFDAPLSFSANLSCEFKSKVESRVRDRCLRNKSSKKTKGKTKQSKSTKQQSIETPISVTHGAQEQEEAEFCSPMDFSPYEETSGNDDVPLSGHLSTAQSNVEPESISGVFTESQSNPGFMKNEKGVASGDSSTGFSPNTNKQDDSGAHFSFSFDGKGKESLTFTASNASSREHRQKKKYRLKPASVAGRARVARGTSSGVSPLLRKVEDVSSNFPASASKDRRETKGDEKQGYDSASAISAAEKACDKWRLRGNEAYEKGELSKAEEFYTWGMNCVPPVNASSASFNPLVRCFSNRAATRMALGRMREAIQDCLMAVKLDPTFHRAQMRAANCYLQLGELEDAKRCFGNILDASNAVCLDRQVIISASEGVQKAQKVTECINHSAELLKLRTSEGASSALDSIDEAMSISLHSEKLLEMKAESLCMLRRHEEAILLCQQTLDFAEKNFSAAISGHHEANNSYLNINLWRRYILSKCHFHLGKLEVALDLIEKQQSGVYSQESSDALAGTIRELLNHKSSGNTAFQSGNHAEAVEHYTTAILSSSESPPFAAICFCNRAAAQQALGQIADAISDCSIAIALDENYAKAVSRRATLHEMIRDYKQATADLQRLVSLLEKQSLEKSKQSGSGNGKELRQVQRRLSLMEEEAKRDIPLDLYLILGVKKSDPASEVKKAYRKAALRHHPDKAGQSLVRNDVGDEGRLWKDIAELVQKDSDRLFKMIGEAYAVLSDPVKREEYDQEEDMRKALKESNNLRSTSRRHSDYYHQGYPFERSSNRRYWQDSYRSYGHSQKIW